MQLPDPLVNPSPWVLTIKRLTQRQLEKGEVDAGGLQRKVRAHGNFTEYVPLSDNNPSF